MATAQQLAFPPNLQQTTDFWDLSKRSLSAQRGGRYIPDAKEDPLSLKAARTWPDVAGAVIDTYSAPGDWILAPMCGTGVELVEAVWRDRNAVGVELEKDRAERALANLELATGAGVNGLWSVKVQDARYPIPELKERPPGSDPPSLVFIDPPFSETRMDGGTNHFGGILGNYTGEDRIKSRGQRDQNNLGNLKHGDYLMQMQLVYWQALQVAADGAYMAVLLKDYRKDFRRIDLTGDTRNVSEAAGWRYYDRATIYLGSASQQQRRNAKANEHLLPVTQTLLIFRKGAGRHAKGKR